MSQDAGPARGAVTVTPHATNALNPIPRALYVGTGGNITLRAKDSSADVSFVGVPSGSILPVNAQYVRVTGTTATDIVGLI